MKPPLNSAYIRISLGYQISAETDNFDILDKVFPKLVFLAKNGKSLHQHLILDIRISLGTKFQVILIFFISWTRFAQKGYFLSETEKLHLRVRPWWLLRADRHNSILMSLLLLVAETNVRSIL